MARPAPRAAAVLDKVRLLAAEFAEQRRERQRRRELDPADFACLADAGFLLTGVPVEHGGLFESAPRSTRLIAEMHRALAGADPSLALVASMHPLMLLGCWRPRGQALAPYRRAWDEQRRWAYQTAREPRPRSPSSPSRR
jgi:alkylation response protein AidB-like acyl-CoA dehydrogenase